MGCRISPDSPAAPGAPRAHAAAERPASVRVHRARIVRKHDLFSLQPLPYRTNNKHRYSPVEGLDFGGPAVIEPEAP